ncbi:uncharacterized protein MalAC0309_2353 [Microcella alkaliphila]|jgi:hypothetical protein|uniref:Uncharacterized protein n=1 Tax=Microcella alkaliphila TaxID=279828 RepID=A0A0U5BQN8_9MICO|nr:uncharacterized protein MalAC0309_2353 [Microcella alkaliphila]
MNDASVEATWPAALSGLEWLRLGDPETVFRAGEGGLLIEIPHTWCAEFARVADRWVFREQRERHPAGVPWPDTFSTTDIDALFRFAVFRLSWTVGTSRSALSHASVGEASSGGRTIVTELESTPLPEPWTSRAADGVGYLSRAGNEVATTVGGTGGGFSYVAHTEGVHPDELLAFALYGGERVPANQVADAVRAFTERNPSYAPGWWRALLGPA